MHLSTIATNSSVVKTTNVNSEIAIDNFGEAWVSQTELAKMCGVAQQTINSAIARRSSYAVGWIFNENNHLSTKSAYDAVVYFATQGI